MLDRSRSFLQSLATDQRRIVPGLNTPTPMANLDQDLQNEGNAAEICREQCMVLTGAFQGIRLDNRNAVHHEMKKGIKLLKSCKRDGWIVRTLLRAESRLEFWEICGFLDHNQRLEAAAQNDRGFLLQMANDVGNIDQASPAENFALSMVRLLLQEGQLQYTEGLPIGFMIGHEISPQITGFIALGAYGAVQSVNWLDHEFAMKTIQAGSLSYRQEVRVLSLKHPNVVSVIGYYYDGNEYSIVMEKMATSLYLLLHMRNRARTLRSLFQRNRRPFKEVEAVLLMLQIAKGMEFLHSNGLLHLDLKPANILVADENCEPNMLVLKIGDFGSSRMVNEIGSEEERNPREGTRGYRAPDERYTEKLDVFSYAMTCYELLSGKNEFTEDDSMLQSGEAQPTLSSRLDDRLQDLLTRCWSHDPDQRPTFTSIVGDLLTIKNDLHV